MALPLKNYKLVVLLEPSFTVANLEFTHSNGAPVYHIN